MNNPATRPLLRSLDIPVPPEDIRYRVASAPIDEAAFLQAGECCASEILRSLDLAGIDAGGLRSILDFGCGCSRVLRYLRPHLAQASFHGFDVDEVAIEWSRQHIDGVRFEVVPHLPPTDCPRGSFDFIYGLSLFSHLDLPRQLLWLAELQRILRPDGLLLLTIHGQFARDLVEGTITEQEKREFDATGFLFVSNIADNVLPDWYQTAIYREDFARFVFGSRFDILRFEAKGMGGCQDVLVLRNRPAHPHPAQRRIVHKTCTGEVARTAAAPHPGDDLRRRMAEIVAEHGPWTAHSIDLGHGVRTFEKSRNSKLLATIHILRTLASKPFNELRILDLGCLEGVYAIELALQGAEVVGIEARAANIAKARFARAVLKLDRADFIQDDVRNISRERHGIFDFVICAGLFYHLDAPDLLPFLERCAEVCRGHLILDTHIACEAREKFRHGGHWYHGYTFREFDSGLSDEQTDGYPWAAHKNRVSFVLTERSLCAALVNAGFDTVAEGLYPYAGFPFRDYAFLIAGKATPMAWKTSPELDTMRLPPLPETETRAPRNPYLADNTVAHPAPGFVVPSESRESAPGERTASPAGNDRISRFAGFRFRTPLKQRLEYSRIKQLKIELIAGAGRAESIRDFGGLWGVYGLYLLEGARILQCRFAEMVDINPLPEFDEKAAELRQVMDVEIKMTRGDFREPRMFDSMREVEVSLLYEVLLHQDNAVEVIKNVAAKTTRCICIAQPVLKEELFALPNGAMNLQFYPEELKDQLRYSGWWENEPPCERFSPQYWMWGQTTSFFLSVMHGYGWKAAHVETFDASEFWNYAMLRFTKEPHHNTPRNSSGGPECNPPASQGNAPVKNYPAPGPGMPDPLESLPSPGEVPGGLATDLDHVFDAVCRIAPACCGTLSADTPLGDGGAGLDSVGFLDLVLDVEKRTGVRLRDENLTAAALATAGTLARHIHLARTTRDG